MYTAQQLCSEFNINIWTLYNWRRKGVLPPPIGGRRYATYSNDHVRIIRAIKKLVHDDRITLNDLAIRLHGEPAVPHHPDHD